MDSDFEIFKYGDKVKVVVDGQFFGEGIVVDYKYDGGHKYCAPSHTYKVKFKGGEINTYIGAELEKKLPVNI